MDLSIQFRMLSLYLKIVQCMFFPYFGGLVSSMGNGRSSDHQTRRTIAGTGPST